MAAGEAVAGWPSGPGGGLARALRAATALTLPRRAVNPWTGFSGLAAEALGRTAAAPRAAAPQAATPQAEPRAARAGIEWVMEAYRRLERLITGEVRPGTPADARRIFHDARITVQRRTTAGGRSTHYLQDELTGASAAAGRVSQRLEGELDHLLGRDTRADRRLANERVTARAYLQALRKGGMLLPDRDAARPPFRDWIDLQIVLAGLPAPAAAPRGMPLAYTVAEREDADGRRVAAGHIGLQVDRCDRTAERTWSVLRRHADGLGLAVPGEAGEVTEAARQGLAEHFLFDPAMTPNTPVLLRDVHLVRAAAVLPGLEADRLEAAFLAGAERRRKLAELGLRDAASAGEVRWATRAVAEAARDASLAGFRAAMSSIVGVSSLLDAPQAQVVDIAAMRAARASRAAAEADRAAAPVPGFSAPHGPAARLSFSPSAVVVRYEGGYPQMYVQRRPGDDPALFRGRHERPLIEVMRLGDLPPGRYPVENEFQMPDGEILVAPDGRVRRRMPEIRQEAAAEQEMAEFDPLPAADGGRRPS